jgi:hypothetical protein
MGVGTFSQTVLRVLLFTIGEKSGDYPYYIKNYLPSGH